MSKLIGISELSKISSEDLDLSKILANTIYDIDKE